MGAKHSCCAYSSPRTDRSKKDKGRRGRENTEVDRYEPRTNSADLGGKVSESCGNLQHISEREPDDWEDDPSLHPTHVGRIVKSGMFVSVVLLPGHHVHGEVQAVLDQRDGAKEIPNATRGLNLYGGFHNAKESFQLFHYLY